MFWFVGLFEMGVSLDSSGRPGTHYVDPAGLKLVFIFSRLCLPAARITGVHHHSHHNDYFDA